VIVQNFDLRIKKGEFVTLIGHSGCGKSTILSMLAGLSEINGGGIILAGKELSGPGPDRGIVFQSPCLLPWLPFHWGQSHDENGCVNTVVQDKTDPISREPELKFSAVRLEKINSAATIREEPS
jgi:ABC-type oligopeptide transport system ATPase subunit